MTVDGERGSQAPKFYKFFMVRQLPMDPVTSNPQGARKRRFDRESSFLEWKPLRLEWLFLCIIIVIGAFLACFPNTSSEVVCLLVIVIYSVKKCDKSRLHTERTNINTPMRWSYHSSATSPLALIEYLSLIPIILQGVCSFAFPRQLRQGDQTLQPPLGPRSDR